MLWELYLTNISGQFALAAEQTPLSCIDVSVFPRSCNWSGPAHHRGTLIRSSCVWELLQLFWCLVLLSWAADQAKCNRPINRNRVSCCCQSSSLVLMAASVCVCLHVCIKVERKKRTKHIESGLSMGYTDSRCVRVCWRLCGAGRSCGTRWWN